MSDQIGILGRLYPEARAGGYTHIDGTVEFYTRVNALLEPHAVVVDLGAGRGGFLEDPVPYRRELRQLRGKAARVIGLDIDEAVLKNPALDEAHVIRPDQAFPLPDGSVDLLLSDFTFEHVVEPGHVAGEIARVLRPGAWLCARTPNRLGYIGIPTRAVPNQLHNRVLARVQPGKQEQDTFPTRYRLNSPADLRRWFPESEYLHCTYSADSEPAYFGNSAAAWRTVRFCSRFTPARYRSVLYIFLQKRRAVARG
jgi:SAM-dependent methyltransferase